MRHTPIPDNPYPDLPGHPFRKWVFLTQPPSAGAPPALQLRIMTYNILSETIRKQTAYLYQNVHDPICGWRHRMGSILAEVEHYKADVVSMQEVQEDSALPQRMWLLGYAHAYIGRTGDKPDGCALFWCALFWCALVRGRSNPPHGPAFVRHVTPPMHTHLALPLLVSYTVIIFCSHLFACCAQLRHCPLNKLVNQRELPCKWARLRCPHLVGAASRGWPLWPQTHTPANSPASAGNDPSSDASGRWASRCARTT